MEVNLTMCQTSAKSDTQEAQRVAPQFMPKYVDLTMLSATFVCSRPLCASEKAVFRNQYLAGSHVSKRWYQHFSYAVKMLLPVR
jgi:hypothetical protein